MRWLNRRTEPPAASEAVHVQNPRRPRYALCGVDLTGEPEMPAGTTVTCPACDRRHS